MTREQISAYKKALDYLDTAYVEKEDLDAAHKIAQQHEGDAIADTIHAIVHRREGDFSNSNYWWRRVGAGIPQELQELYGDAATFTNQVRDSVRDGRDAGRIAEVQAREIDILRRVLDTKKAKPQT